MQRLIAFALLACTACFGLHAGEPTASAQQPNAPPVNPDATPAARALLLEIDGLSGHATLSGQHNFPNSVSRYSDRVYDLTGKFPALFGQDLGFSSDPDKDLTRGRAELVKEVTRQYRAGAVIALTWHAVRPTDEEPVTFPGSVQAQLTDWEWKQVLTPGTDLYNRWCRQVDLVAGYLRELQDAGVPVLFRPYHEMNGKWFWWGGRPGPNGSVALYRQLYDRYVHLHHLNNLVWVWNVNSPNGNAGPIEAYFPGPGYADVVSMDIYSTFEQKYYDSMVALAGPSHPIALAEVGTMPTLEVLAQQPRWTYFMVWSTFEENANTPEQLQAMYHAPNVIDRGDPRLPAPLPPPTTAPAPVTPDADAAAKALLARLYDRSAPGVLSGQEIDLSSRGTGRPDQAATSTPSTTSADGASSSSADMLKTVAEVTGKRPALVELTFGDPTDKQILPTVRQLTKAGEIPLLRWAPPSPTDGSSTGALTDFEWQQLMRPGSEMNGRWMAQVNRLEVLLKQLQTEHLAVLWSPFPAPNARGFWWSGRPGVEGSAALLRMLFGQLVRKDHLSNLLWVWEPAAPGMTPGAAPAPSQPGSLIDYFPGPLYADALALDINVQQVEHGNATRGLDSFAGNKPLGLHVDTGVPAPAVLEKQTHWRWIALPSADLSDPSSLRGFYGGEHVLSEPAVH